MKKLTVLMIVLALLTGCTAPIEDPPEGRPQVVAAIFPAYDFARAAAGDCADVELLLPPGAESHSYEPTPADILKVQRCDLFLYLGGESDTWVDTILSAIDMKGTAMRMVDCVELLEEQTVEGMQAAPGHEHEHEHEEHEHGPGEVVGMDEHVWTDPENAAIITEAVGEALAAIDPSNADAYRASASTYAADLRALDADFSNLFQSLPDRTMVFGDRFPLRYFAEAYDIDYYAAFPGCGTQTEPSAATIAFLTKKVQTEQLPAVWYIEFSNHLVADSIAEATGTQSLQFHTCHNVSKTDLTAGATYLTLMRQNLQTLTRVLKR